MHPYQHVFFHRAPSRIFWFLLGAGAATWWHYASPVRDHRAQFFSALQRRPVESATDAPAQDTPSWKPTWGPDRHIGGWAQRREWEQERERLMQLQKRAGETVADLSESTLDSMIAGAESMKVKLAQLRAERERLQAEKNAPPTATSTSALP